MKYYELDTTEKKILKDFERDHLTSVKHKKEEVRRYENAAKATLNRIRNINLRLSERDLQKMKAKAAEKGIPYQTLVTSILHEYTSR
ncbi:MAG: hypothetical protein G01um101433_268 [Parcubacteria group bacterium Gr01-1014_33]|nr:MAG: hypothetical protein G01um101433_268 [Parcubacteria group bacterium Gr01-1014_33]